MKISVIVLNYNDSRMTYDYVNKIQSYTIIDRIIVVDNCSTDNSYMVLSELNSDKITLLKTSANNGYAAGNNEGLRFILSEGYNVDDIVIISNPDIVIEESAIVAIINAFKIFPNLFAATGEVYNLDNKRINLFTWKIPSATMLFLESSITLRKIGHLFHYARRYFGTQLREDNDYYHGDALPGCFFAANIDLFHKLNLFNEETFLYFEEDCLFAKAKKANYKSCVVKGAKIIHLEGITTKKNIKSWKKRELIMERSCKIYMKCHLNMNNILQKTYTVWNRIWLGERFLFMNLKEK